MRCPTCQTVELLMAERVGVEIDYCPKCRGVWLDRGELDKIIERASAPQVDRSQPAQPPAYAPYGSPPPEDRPTHHPHDPSHRDRRRKDDDDDNDDSKHGYRYQEPPHPRKKKNWLGEIFDVF